MKTAIQGAFLRCLQKYLPMAHELPSKAYEATLTLTDRGAKEFPGLKMSYPSGEHVEIYPFQGTIFYAIRLAEPGIQTAMIDAAHQSAAHDLYTEVANHVLES